MSNDILSVQSFEERRKYSNVTLYVEITLKTDK